MFNKGNSKSGANTRPEQASRAELERLAGNIAEARRAALAAQNRADKAKANYRAQLEAAHGKLTDEFWDQLMVRLLDLKPDSNELLDRASIRYLDPPF